MYRFLNDVDGREKFLDKSDILQWPENTRIRRVKKTQCNKTVKDVEGENYNSNHQTRNRSDRNIMQISKENNEWENLREA